jgi:hypothetical protein
MRAEEFSEQIVEVHGWQCRLTSYRLDEVYYCQADNVSPGARLARTSAPTKEEAERKALDRATELLSRTQRRAVRATGPPAS